MGDFNQFLQEGKAYLNSLLAKIKQLNHHTASVLAQHQYGSLIIHVEINDLLSCSSIEQKSKDVIEIVQWFRNKVLVKVLFLVLFIALK